MRELLRRLGNPQSQLKIIHVAGTKGKGSTSAMIAASLQTAGYRVGVYSSPHLECFEERIAIDGSPCSTESLVELVEQIKPIAEAMDTEMDTEGEANPTGPTFFDLSTAMALTHFTNQRVDAVVLEVGLGGRLDSTNVCMPVVSVITSISRDHTRQLGDTLAEIASEKAGIIKTGVPVVSGVVQSDPSQVIQQKAKSEGAPLWQRDRDFFIARSNENWEFTLKTNREQVSLSKICPAMHGSAQAENASVALATLGALRGQGWDIAWEACQKGIATARLPARMECFAGEPLVVLDGAHNEAAAIALTEALPRIAPQATERTLIVSIAEDKEAEAVLRPLLPLFNQVLVTQFLENPRAREAKALAELVGQLMAEHPTDQKPTIPIVSTPADAWCKAVRGTDPSGVIVVAGSFFLAAEVRRLILANRSGQ